MVIDGRGKEDSIPYERLKTLITKEACTLDDIIEVLVDQEVSAKRINILATLAGYDTVIEQREGCWALKIDSSRRRCF